MTTKPLHHLSLEVLTAVFAGIGIFVLIMIWAIYGLACANDCGMIGANCQITKMQSVIQVCQDDRDSTYQPYSGVLTYCFNLTTRSGDMMVECIDDSVACGATPAEVLSEMSGKYQIGETRSCSYGFPTPKFDGTYYFRWGSPTDFDTWIKVNIIISIVAALIILVSLVVYLCFCCRHRPRNNVYYSEKKIEYEEITADFNSD